jgi:phage terminase small subunit
MARIAGQLHRNDNNLTVKQQMFADTYLAEPDLNATQAAIKCGYSAHTAGVIANKMLKDVYLHAYIESRLKSISDAKIADADEVMRYLTAVVRGETTEDAIIVKGTGLGISQAETISKRVPARDTVKAAELLARRYGLLTDKIDMQVQGTITIDASDDIQEPNKDDA